MNFLSRQKKNIILTFFAGVILFSFLIPVVFSGTRSLIVAHNPVTLSSGSGYNQSSPLGINLSGIAPWSTQFPFVDYFKSSRTWITQCQRSDPGCSGEWDTKEDDLLQLDENGWVKSLPKPEDSPQYTRVSTSIFRGIPERYPSGKYIILYDGEGTIEYRQAAKKDANASTPGRDVIEVDSTVKSGVLLTITTTDPNQTGNYIRNIRIIKAENESLAQNGEIFNPEFIEKIQKFRALRFMDWMATNHSKQKEWQNRPNPEIASYYTKGVPIEVMIALANQVKADPWFNIPHQATDEYITKFAQLVKEKLDPDIKVYVEFSNEVWNWNFKQTHYALEEGQKRWGKDKGDAFRQWYGMRTAQMCDIWKETFGNEKYRVVCVIGTQSNVRKSETQVLDCPYWVKEGNKPCYQHGIDAYAITGYFSGALGQPDNTSTIESWLKEPDGGMTKAFEQLRKGGLLPDDRDSLLDNYEKFVYHSNLAKERGLQLVAYEGGQHIVGRREVVNNDQLTNFFIELNRHPQMYDIYTQLLENWQQAGGTLFMHFVDISRPSKWGSWGALEYQSQEGSPKYNALMDFMNSQPCWWENCQSKS